MVRANGPLNPWHRDRVTERRPLELGMACLCAMYVWCLGDCRRLRVSGRRNKRNKPQCSRS